MTGGRCSGSTTTVTIETPARKSSVFRLSPGTSDSPRQTASAAPTAKNDRLERRPAVLRRRTHLPRMPVALRFRVRILGKGRSPRRTEDATAAMAARKGARGSEVPKHREEALARSWYTEERLRGVWSPRVAWAPARHAARPPERHAKRQPAREPTNALRKLPQPNGDLRFA